MSNCQRFEVPNLELVGWHLVSSALRPIIHTIVFVRGLEVTRPQELRERDLGVTYATVPDVEIEQYVTRKIQEFVMWLHKQPSHSGSLKLAFHDQPEKKGAFFGEPMSSCWEEWTISVTVLEQNTFVPISQTKDRVSTCLGYITQSVMLHQYPLPSLGKVSLIQLFRISIVMNSRAAEMFHAVHRALQDINTTSLLR